MIQQENRLIIEMIELTKDFKPDKEGKYLVRTVSNHLQSVNMFVAKVYANGKVDINNQKATHISKYCLE